ncbi:type-2 angiotensin II receptor-like isoform X2 [Megalops cyprinoides]|nr:type-2 angiotensin II receptor-like isoform X2 [Megalops cyprinoides]XP_036404828.1 type-2 angiotensin II receptor-like isoform X2 [Megalops cyprinoides]XP_036404829.1 type-2 angiotensin II receptor-like isoform X2 [Megalops cyprinoides]
MGVQVVTMATLLLHNLSSAITSTAAPSVNQSCQNVLPSQHHNKLISAIYSIIFILGFVGNGLVVLVLCQKASRRTVANIYILNLALSDLLFLLSLPFWAVYYSYDYNWVFGSFMCKLCGSLLTLNLYASIFFITCMSVDRYLAIVHPFQLQSRRNLCQARLFSCAVWAVACLATLPTMIFRGTHYVQEMEVVVCGIHYPTPAWDKGLSLMKNILGFLLPFTVIATCYCCIGRHLLGSPGLDKTTNNLDRVLKVVVAVVLAFFICWFPFHVLTFLDALFRLGVAIPCWVRQGIEVSLPFMLCLGFSNSAVNPFLYCFVGNHFREQLSSLYEARVSSLSQKRGSISTRLSSFSRKLSDLKDLGPVETQGQHTTP